MKQKIGTIAAFLLILSLVHFTVLDLKTHSNSGQDQLNMTRDFSITQEYPDIQEIPVNTPVQLIQDFEMIYPDSLQFDEGILWYGYKEYRELGDGGSESSINELYLFNGTSVEQLTNNSVTEKDYIISEGIVAWSEYDGHDYEIWRHKDGKTLQITHNEVDDYLPQVYKNFVTWTNASGPSEPSHVNLISLGIYLDLGLGTNPKIHDGGVVWEYDGDIFLFNGTETSQITVGSFEYRNPRIYEGNVTWEGNDGNDIEIFLYNGSIQQITNNTYLDSNPKFGNYLVWHSYDGEDGEIFFYDRTRVIQITNNEYNDSCVETFRNIVVWQVDDGDGYDIMCYDHSIQYPSFRITNNETSNNYCPDVDNGIITWVNSNSIYVFRLNATEMIVPIEPSWDSMHTGIISIAIVSIAALVVLSWIQDQRK